MIFVFYFFAAILIFLGYKSFRGGIEYLNYFKRELAKPKSSYKLFASIFVPCRGIDDDLEENLSAIFRQDYPNYEIIFAVDDKNDKAVSIIKNLIHNFENTISAKLIIAGKAENEGQKVHNLRKAVLEVSDKSEVFVFVDSDARPDKNWLANLVAPLADENIGCATGYRWFIAKNGGFASQLRSVWNASIASALGANRESNFCWGGSTAIRRETFENLEIRKIWKGTLSDDFALTNALKNASLPIHFVPECLTATVEDCTLRELFEFTTRQMKITRVYSPQLWKISFVGSFIFTAVFFVGIVLLFFVTGWHFWFIMAALVLIIAFGIGKAWIRLEAVKLVLENYESELKKSFWWHTTLWMITPAIYFYNNIRAWQSNEIVWRGIKYKLKSPNETHILRND